MSALSKTPLCACAVFFIAASASAGRPITSLDLFQQRILPIFQAKSPSSCSECHLSGVDLKNYIDPSQEKTFASLRQAGLVDVERPDRSKILEFIGRKPEKPNLITDNVRQQEYEAFRAWIHAAVKDPRLLAAKTDSSLGPQVPVEVLRHARQDHVLASFIENIWSEVGRCAACHSPDRNQQQVKKHGPQVSWIKLNDPRATLDYLLEAELINAQKPEESLLVQKPTQQVEHAGGQKMMVGDRSYKQFRRFLDDYAAVVAGKYRSASDLPPPGEELSQVSEIWFKIEGIPNELDKLMLQVDIYRWNERTGDWSAARSATADRAIAGARNLWQQHLTLTAPRDAADASSLNRGRLPPGRYLAKIYVDRQGKAQKDFTYVLGKDEFLGEVEINTRWPAGYGQMTVAEFPNKR